ncbi:MAG: DUF1266 domain-containing protein [Propionibacteriaceae bacterium]|jgi:uncharacterized membrane protein YphA (DoxX/SURF4 family)|nr:DUF1266 domain-containing protein [Propionibacteriaceae bacterium]
MVFKFLKELATAAKEGVDEAKAEAAAKAGEDSVSGATPPADAVIGAVPAEEKFGVALGAQFRSTFFADWFTLFKSSPGDDSYPVHLYTCGSYPDLADHTKSLRQLLQRDFDITDQTSCRVVLGMFFTSAGIPTTGTSLEDMALSETSAGPAWDWDCEGVDALVCSIVSHITSAAVDVGYLDKTAALPILRTISAYARSRYHSWAEYNTAFLAGEAAVGLNNKAGRTLLTKQTRYLLEKKGSPWNNIPW